GPRTLTVTGPPPSGEQWYWQGTEENGTSTETEDDASLPYTVTETGTYYIGAVRGNCWRYSSVYVEAKLFSDATPELAPVQYYCGSAKVSKSQENPNWYWLPDENTFTTENNQDELLISSSSTVYLAALGTNGCWSDVVSLEINIPLSPSNITVTGNTSLCLLGSTALSASGADYYIWHDSEGNVLGTGPEFITPDIVSSTEFTVTGYTEAGGCATVNVPITIQSEELHRPDIPTLTKSLDQYYLDVNNSNTTSYSYHWQDSPDGTDMIGHPN